MATFLSDEWFEELARQLRDAGHFESSTRLALGQTVIGTPHGEVSYTLILGGNEPSEVVRGIEGAAVILVEDYSTAVAIATGRPSSELLAEGKVKIQGEVGALLRAHDLLVAIGPTLAALAASTTYI